MPEPTLILYEGEEDKSCLKALLEARNLSSRFIFHHECNGNAGFQRQLEGLVAESGIEKRKAIIIVGDNDGDYTASFNLIRRQIEAAGFIAPPRPRELAATTGLPPVAVLMLPWDNEPGCLETLFLSATNSRYASQLACANGLVDCARATTWPVAMRSKLCMRGLLSSICSTAPNMGLRYAFTPGRGSPLDIFDLMHPCFDNISGYLRTF